MSWWRWFLAFLLMKLLGRGRGRDDAEGAPPNAPGGDRDGDRIVASGSPQRSAENLVLALLAIAAAFALGFVAVYAAFSPRGMPNELLGLCLGMALVSIGGALAVVGHRLVVTEELEGEYPQEHPEAQREIVEILRESGSRVTRKRLLLTAGAGAGGALGLAAAAPLLSLGPLWDTGPLDRTPWRAGVRLVDLDGRPIAASDVIERTFYTAFPEGADPEDIASPLIVIRVDPAKLELAPDRAGWAPDGILAFSKICTHAGCAVALYRKPTFAAVEPSAALICPCHYSTFDPFTGGTVIYGPAGRPLPQLPLTIDRRGELRAGGNFSGRVGPSWWNVRSRPT